MVRSAAGSVMPRLRRHLPSSGGPRTALVALALLLIGAGCRPDTAPPKTYADTPIRGAAELEVAAELGAVLGNVAVSPAGRIFITYHPEGVPDVKVAEILPGNVSRPYPDDAWQLRFESPQGIKLDARGRLWVLDHGKNGFGTPALYGFDIATGSLVHERALGSAEGVGWGSHLNDLSIDAERDVIYIADTSSYRMNPALLVYDVRRRQARRVLEGHKSVEAERVDTRVEGRKLRLLFIPIHVAVDSIVLDLANEYLYFAPFSGTRMYRVRTAALRDETLAPAALASAVEDYGPKPISDGITIDRQGTIYITAVEDQGVTLLHPPAAGTARGGDEAARQATIVRDPRIIWADGLSFGPDGWVYLTDSQLNRVLFRSRRAIARLGPHYLYRFRALADGLPGR
jgi:sugar lactone lactonase YvrE